MGAPVPRSSALIGWLREQDLLRGPFLFADYWATVLGLEGVTPPEQVEAGLSDPHLYRLGLDRPDLEMPGIRSWLPLLLAGPLLLLLRPLRRLGRYTLHLRAGVSGEVARRLESFALRLEPTGPRRVRVSLGKEVLAEDVLDPALVGGFSSLFWAANKLPLASFTAILLMAVLAPLAHAGGMLGPLLQWWVPVGFPLLVVVLRLLFREWPVAVLGALPVVVGRYLFAVVGEGGADWSAFLLTLGALFGVYLLADWFFVPRPVPPVLLLYTADGPGRPYARAGDAPWWLEGRTYWVWRSMLLSRAEINKFWERDWERVELWIRADGPDAGVLEWVVSDLHYRELWFPLEEMGDPATMQRQRERALVAVREGEPGVWMVEADADLVFHYPMLRGATFVPDGNDIPVRGVLHLLRALRTRLRHTDITAAREALARARLRAGPNTLADLPEVIASFTEERLLTSPWRYWRYPLGAARRREHPVYGLDSREPPPPAADPLLQIKAPG